MNDENDDRQIMNQNSDENDMNQEHVDFEQDDLSRMDPMTIFLSRLDFPDVLVQELDACNWDQSKYDKYYRSTDLFIIRDILGNAMVWEQDQDSIYHRAFCNLMKWMMFMIATNNYWHRRLCYYNRMMGTNTHSTSYWKLQYHPAYIPGVEWNKNLDQEPKGFNDGQKDLKGIYQWIEDQEDQMFEAENEKGVNDDMAAAKKPFPPTKKPAGKTPAKGGKKTDPKCKGKSC